MEGGKYLGHSIPVGNRVHFMRSGFSGRRLRRLTARRELGCAHALPRKLPSHSARPPLTLSGSCLGSRLAGGGHGGLGSDARALTAAGRFSRNELVAVLHYITPKLRGLLLRALRALRAGHSLLRGGPASRTSPVDSAAAGSEAALASGCGGVNDHYAGGSNSGKGVGGGRGVGDCCGEGPRKQARLSSADPEMAVQDMLGGGGDVILVDSDSPESDEPESESPEGSIACEIWHSDSEASPRAAQLEGTSAGLVDHAGEAGAGGCPSVTGDGLGAAIEIGAAEDSDWPLDSGPGLWQDQNEWGFLGVTFDAETQKRRSVKCNLRLAEILGVCREKLQASLVAQEADLPLLEADFLATMLHDLEFSEQTFKEMYLRLAVFVPSTTSTPRQRRQAALVRVLKVIYLCQPVTPLEYNEAVLRDPRTCPLFMMGDLRSGRQLLEDFSADARRTIRRMTENRRGSPVLRRIASALGSMSRRLEARLLRYRLPAKPRNCAYRTGGNSSAAQLPLAVPCKDAISSSTSLLSPSD